MPPITNVLTSPFSNESASVIF